MCLFMSYKYKRFTNPIYIVHLLRYSKMFCLWYGKMFCHQKKMLRTVGTLNYVRN